MAIDRAMTPMPLDISPSGGTSVDLNDLAEASLNVQEQPDGSVVINIDAKPKSEDHGDVPFDANLAEHLEKDELTKISTDLLAAFDADEMSRKEWRDTLSKGLDLLGMKIEDRTMPWSGACGVYHPILAEAVVRFQSNAIMEIFPAGGPVRTKIIGRVTEDVEKQADRVEEDMNYQLTERMTEFRPETEQMLFALPLAGSAFKKVYADPTLKRAVSIYVPAEDLVVAYGASELQTAPRYTHIMKKTKNEIRKLQVSGFYRDVELTQPPMEMTRLQEKIDKLEGTAMSVAKDDRFTLLEMHVEYEMPGFDDEDGIALPYVVTLEKYSGEILSIRRNWYEDDELRQKRLHFVHYQYLPGLSFYGFGLVHLIGGIAKSATSILRQLVDAGTLSNLPAGLKTRGMRIKGDNSPFMPGELRDTDVPGNSIKDNIFMLPFKEPSAVLLQLLNNLIDEGRRFASIADVEVGDMSQNAPVGTTLALLERALKVMSAVQARLHYSMKQEFKLIANIIRDYMPDQPYDFDVDAPRNIRREDYSDRVDVIPVSDPNSATMSQRIVQYQAALELSKTAPNIYDQPELHRQMLRVLGLKDVDSIVPSADDIKPMDPITENMAILTSKPVKAFIYQDHEAHIKVHLAAIQDPKIAQIVGQSPNAQQIVSAAEAHVREHVAFEYRRQIEQQLGVSLPDPDEPLPQDVESNLSKLVADAADRLLAKDVQEMKAQEAARKMQDPVVQAQLGELEVKKMEVARKTRADEMAHQAKLLEIESKLQAEQQRRQTTERLEGAKLGANVARDLTKAAIDGERVNNEQATNAARTGVDIARLVMDGKLRNKQIEAQREGTHKQVEVQRDTAEIQADTQRAAIKEQAKARREQARAAKRAKNQNKGGA